MLPLFTARRSLELSSPSRTLTGREQQHNRRPSEESQMRAAAGIRTLMLADCASPCRPPSAVSSILSALQTSSPPAEHPPDARRKDHIPLLEPFAAHLSSCLVMEVIHSPHCRKNPLSALHFFYWAAPRFSPAASCYTAVVELLLSHRLFAAAESLLPAVAASSSWATHHDFLAAKFIARFGELGDIRRAVDWFHRRRSSLGRYSHGAILRVLVRANRVRLARAIFDQILEEGRPPPDVAAFTTMIRGYCKLGLMAEAEGIFRAMSCRPNLVTYNTLVDGYCRKGMMDSARAALEMMVRKEDCSPDAVTFTTLISGFNRRGKVAEAKACLEEMERRWKLRPNLHTYNAVIGGLRAAGDTEAAAAMTVRMRLDGIKADVVTLTCLMKGLCAAGRPDEAAARLREMGAAAGMELDSMAYGPVVKEYCRAGRPADAMKTLDEMASRNITPHVSLFNALLAALAESGELDKAARLVKEMRRRRGCKPTFLSYSIVIAGLCGRRGRMGQAEELVGEMRRAGHRPDRGMYSGLVEAYCREGELGMAARVSCDAAAEGVAVQASSFEGVVKGLCSLGRQAEARELFDEMRRRLPNTVTGEFWREID